MKPATVLEAARDLLGRHGLKATTLYPRAAALLARQALEARVRGEWRDHELPLAETSMTNQFHALRQLRDPRIAGEAYEAWAALSHVCHHHPYDLTPTPAELATLLDTVATLVTANWQR